MKDNKLLREFFKYTALNIFGMVGISVYILADTFFVSRGIGSGGLAALNIALPAYSLVNGCGLMLSMGGATKYSIAKGSENHKYADRIFTNTVFSALLMSVFFVLLGTFFSEKITLLLGADSEIFEMTNIYLKVILLFSPAFIFNNIFICFVRNDKNPNLAMISMLSGSLFNIVFDYIFIFPMKMGIFGAVLATGFSPVVGMLVMTAHKRKGSCGFHFVKSRISPRLILSSASLGFPSLVSELSSGIVIIVFNIIILKAAANIGVAAYGVIANLSMVLIAVYTGIAQGVQPLASKIYGKHDKYSMRKLLSYSVILCAAVSLAVYLGVYFSAELITSVFNSEGNVQLKEIAVPGLRYYFFGGLFAGLNIIAAVFFTSAEKPAPAHILSLLRGFILIIPAAFLLSSHWGIVGVWLSFPISEALTSAVGLLLLIKYREAF